jgi:hypothetical protein
MGGYAKIELQEAQKAVASMIMKLEKCLPGLDGKKPQYALAERRIAALKIGAELIDKELEKPE